MRQLLVGGIAAVVLAAPAQAAQKPITGTSGSRIPVFRSGSARTSVLRRANHSESPTPMNAIAITMKGQYCRNQPEKSHGMVTRMWRKSRAPKTSAA